MKKLLLLCFVFCLGQSLSAQTSIISQDFESGALPAGWSRSQTAGSDGWEFGINTALQSQYYPIPAHTKFAAANDDDCNCTANADYLITPVMNLTTYTSVLLDFEYQQPGNYGSTGHIRVTTNGGTNWSLVSTVATSATWVPVTINLSAYAGMNNVQVGFHHNDNGQWADGFAIDDVEIYAPMALDGALDQITMNDFLATGSSNVTGVIQNLGANTITSLDLHYNINGGSTYTQNLTGLSIATAATYNFTHSTPANLATAGLYTINVWFDNVNGGTDGNAANNSLSKDVSVLSQIPAKNAILEDHTGAWCQFCPDGTVQMGTVLNNHANAIGVAVHNGDAMVIAAGTTIQNAYIGGYPSGIIDHFKFESEADVEINRGLWNAKMGERLAMIVPVSVSLQNFTYQPGTRTIDVDVVANFYGTLSGDLRFNFWIVEDSVTGTGNGYNQVNYYNTQTGHPMFGLGNPIIGFVHDHTLRAAQDGAWGGAGVIPGTVNDGSSYTKHYTVVLPGNWNTDHIKVIGMVQRYSADPTDRQIYNAMEADLSTASPVGIADPAAFAEVMGVFPNPFSEKVAIQFNLKNNSNVTAEVYDIYGKRVATLAYGQMGAGINTVYWNGDSANGPASNGVYMVQLSSEGQKVTQKVVLQR